MVTRASLRKQYAIINALMDIEHPNIKKIHDVTDIPITTLKRHLYSLSADFGMDIVYTKRNNLHNDNGYFMIIEWGIIDRNSFIVKYGDIKS